MIGGGRWQSGTRDRPWLRAGSGSLSLEIMAAIEVGEVGQLVDAISGGRREVVVGRRLPDVRKGGASHVIQR